MDFTDILALLLFSLYSVFLIQRNLPGMIIWLGLSYMLFHYLVKMSHFHSVTTSIFLMHILSIITNNRFESFEEEKKEVEKGPDPAPAKTDDPHVDVGTTILHAYRNLSPEQIGGMRRDTKELMGLQKELMGSLSEMKPAIEQGAELLKTFSQFFGKNE
jgi:hypothetical protein